MAATSQTDHLTRGTLLARNTIWSLIGNVSPLIVAVFCIPRIIKGLGTDRFGLLTIVWAVIGYASLFDLGLGRALTQLVAKKLGEREEATLPSLAWTSLLLMLVLGLFGTIVVVSISPWLVHHMLKIPASLQGETLNSFYLLGLSIPVVILTAGLRGLLEAQQRFGVINVLRIPMGMITFVAPLLVLPFSKGLVPVVAVLVISRIIACIAHLVLCIKITPNFGRQIAIDRSVVVPLLRFGGWMTVSNIVGPLMVTFDRFLIGAMISVGAVAYYSTPYEVVTKLWVIPGALVAVLFPAFSTSAVQDRARMSVLFERGVKYLFLILFPITLLTVAFAKDALGLWLGSDFAQKATPVLEWLAVGVFINSLANVPFALVQGIGRPDWIAKLHLLELPIYLISLLWLVKTLGISGAAIAWTARVTIDAVILFVMARRFLPVQTIFKHRGALIGGLSLIAIGLAALPLGMTSRAVFLLVVALIFVPTAWLFVLSAEERNLRMSLFRSSTY